MCRGRGGLMRNRTVWKSKLTLLRVVVSLPLVSPFSNEVIGVAFTWKSNLITPSLRSHHVVTGFQGYDLWHTYGKANAYFFTSKSLLRSSPKGVICVGYTCKRKLPPYRLEAKYLVGPRFSRVSCACRAYGKANS